MRKKSIFAIFMAVVMMMLAMPVSVSAVANNDGPIFIEVKNDCCVDKEEFGKFWDCQCTVTKTVRFYREIRERQRAGFLPVLQGDGTIVYVPFYVWVVIGMEYIGTQTICVSCGRVINSSFHHSETK